jgi:hypothetical protein
MHYALRHPSSGVRAAMTVFLALPVVISAPVTAQTTSEQCRDLIVSQVETVGEVCVTLTGEDVDLLITTMGEVRLLETRVAVASDLSGFPLSESGVPKLGLFPHSATHQPPTSSTSYQISVAPLDLVSGELLISVQASVLDGSQVEHGAWPVGIRFREPGNPATYFSITVPDGRSGR